MPDAATDSGSARDSGPAHAQKPGSTEPPDDAIFEEALGYDWTLDAGAEQYYCVYKTLNEDLWISSFRPLQPPGTHHVTLGFIEPGPDDGVIESGSKDTAFPCDGTTLGDRLAYGAVVNTSGFSMPDGVAVRIPAGKQMMLSVHVFNGTAKPLSGRTGVEIASRDPADVEQEAELVFANNIDLEVEPGRSSHFNTCTMASDATLLALFHHMHLAGVHMKTWIEPVDGDPYSLLDADFEFDNQALVVLDPPVQVYKGDKMRVECQFENAGSKTLKFGESTVDNEMCFTGFYRYPAVAKNYNCFD